MASLRGGVLSLAGLLLAVPGIPNAPPNSSATCSIQHVATDVSLVSITGAGVQPNEEVAVSVETPYDTYGTYLLTSLPDGTFAIYTYVDAPGLYSASVTLHRYSKPVATCSAVL